MAESISIAELLDAPEYELLVDEASAREIHTLFSTVLSSVDEIASIIANLVPPDYRDRICVMGSERVDGTGRASVGVLPNGVHGRMFFMHVEASEQPCPGRET